MLRRFSTKRVLTFLVLDCFGTLAMLLLSATLRDELGDLPLPLVNLAKALGISTGRPWVAVTLDDVLSPQVFILVALIWPFFFMVFSVYDGRHNETLGAELRNVFLAICVSTMTLAGILYLTYRETPRMLFVIFFALDAILLLSSRVMLWAYRRSRNGQRRAQRRAIIVVGAGPVGRNVIRQLKKYAWTDIDLIGYVDDDLDKTGQEFEGLPVLGALDEIPALVKTYDVKGAVVALPLRAHRRLVDTCRTLQRLSVRVEVIPDLFALSFPSATLDGFGGIPVIDLGQQGAYGWQRLSKRVFDTIVASLVLLLLSPLLLAVAILIKIESPGPIIYRQDRIGENGCSFEMFKFRSMRVDADPDLHKAHVTRLIRQNLSLEQVNSNGQRSLKLEDDPRVTRIGRIIRRTSVDELPQLFNVVRGEMSLVGPRPALPYEVQLYKDWHKRRLEAVPGITGWWQVKGRNRVSFDEMVRMDIHYIERMSFWLDLRILLLTPWAAITGKGAG